MTQMKLAHILVCHTTDPTKTIDSIPHEPGAIWYVFLHSLNVEIEAVVFRLMAARGGNVFPYKLNRGLARSWNDGLHLAMEANCDAVILLNDDLFFYENGYKSFIQTVEMIKNTSELTSFVTVNGLESGKSELAGKVIQQSFACCAIMRKCIERVGYFDEAFTPAYFEDFDYNNRARSFGLNSHLDQRTLVEHERSSTSHGMPTKERENLKAAFEINRQYYTRKWGEDTNIYSTPFNSSKYNGYIAFSQRFNPYPGD